MLSEDEMKVIAQDCAFQRCSTKLRQLVFEAFRNGLNLRVGEFDRIVSQRFARESSDFKIVRLASHRTTMVDLCCGSKFPQSRIADVIRSRSALIVR